MAINFAVPLILLQITSDSEGSISLRMKMINFILGVHIIVCHFLNMIFPRTSKLYAKCYRSRKCFSPDSNHPIFVTSSGSSEAVPLEIFS